MRCPSCQSREVNPRPDSPSRLECGSCGALFTLRPLEPPTGRLCLVFTDVQGSTGLWERYPNQMGRALELHHGAIRAALAQHEGYEVKSDGDAFMVAFADPVRAIRFGVAVQQSLLEQPWPEVLLQDPLARVELSEAGTLLFRGLRVRMGAHIGEPDSKRDPTTGRTDYFGRMVNLASRVASAADGGQILISGALWDELNAGRLPIGDDVDSKLLGAHHLRGIEASVRLVQVGLKALSERRFRPRFALVPRTNLSSNAQGDFVGRRRDLARLSASFSEAGRVITIVGPGGMGKTRLASQFGAIEADLASYPGGVWFCDLTEARGLDGITQAVGDALDMVMTSGSSPEDSVLQVGYSLATRGRVLLILDNFEQLVSHAAITVARWLSMAPEARFLITSREPLRIRGERPLEVAALTVPAPGQEGLEEIHACEAVQLFLDRSRLSRPGLKVSDDDLRVIATIVRQLEGLPLAIELAAARMKVLTPRQINERLTRQLYLLESGWRESSARQASLRGAIDWSWTLLAPYEKTALMDCAVFRGGFSLEAAEVVVDLSEHPGCPSTIDVVQALREKSMLRSLPASEHAAELRFGMYESIRDFVRERTPGDRFAAAGQRHALFYVELGRAMAAEVNGAGALEAIERLQLELDNLAAVIERQARLKPPDSLAAESALWAAVAADAVLALRGPFTRHSALLDAALAVNAEASPELRSRVLLARGQVNSLSTESLRFLNEALALSEKADDKDSQIRAHVVLSIYLREHAKPTEAAEHLARAQALGPPPGTWLEAYVLGNLGNIEAELGRVGQAQAFYERSLMVFRLVKDRRYEAWFTLNLGHVALMSGHPDQALQLLNRGMELCEEMDERRAQGTALILQGFIFWEKGQLIEASEVLQRAIRTVGQMGNRLMLASVLLPTLGGIAATLDDFPEAEAAFGAADDFFRTGEQLLSEYVTLMRGHLDLAFARRAKAEGKPEAAEKWRVGVEQRLAAVSVSMADASLELRFARKTLLKALNG